MKQKIRLVHLETWSVQKQTWTWWFGWHEAWKEIEYEISLKKGLEKFEHLVFGFPKTKCDSEILFEAEISEKNKTSEAYEAFKNLTQNDSTLSPDPNKSGPQW